MAHAAETSCAKCKQYVKVYVDEDRMPTMQERFRYQCPHCSETIDEALGVFSPVDSIPADAVIAERA